MGRCLYTSIPALCGRRQGRERAGIHFWVPAGEVPGLPPCDHEDPLSGAPLVKRRVMQCRPGLALCQYEDDRLTLDVVGAAGGGGRRHAAVEHTGSCRAGQRLTACPPSPALQVAAAKQPALSTSALQHLPAHCLQPGRPAHNPSPGSNALQLLPPVTKHDVCPAVNEGTAEAADGG